MKRRELAEYIKETIVDVLTEVSQEDVDTAKEGQSGPDILLSRIARKLCPYQFEIKSQNRMATVYNWYNQANKKIPTAQEPVVVMKMNSRDPLVVLSVDHFFDLIK